MTHTEWPMMAVIEHLNAEGEWVHYSEISTLTDAKIWIEKRADPENWRARAR